MREIDLKKMTVLIFFLALLGGVNFAQASDSSESKADSAPKGEKVKQNAKATVEATKELVNEKREKFQKDVKGKFDKVSKEIDELQARAEKTEGKAKQELNEQIADLKKKKKKLGDQIDALSKASEEAWDTMKDGVESAWKDLSTSFKKASQRLSKKSE